VIPESYLNDTIKGIDHLMIQIVVRVKVNCEALEGNKKVKLEIENT
jgi:hypothetical protein